MGTKDKHIRLTEKAGEMITTRDRNNCPSERDFINEAIISYADRMEMRKLVSEFRELKRITEKLYKTVGWQ